MVLEDNGQFRNEKGIFTFNKINLVEYKSKELKIFGELILGGFLKQNSFHEYGA